MASTKMRVRTDTLMRRIFKAEQLDDLLRQNEDSMETGDFCSYINELCVSRCEVPERVIRRSEIDRTYGHQLFNGARHPSRDKVLQLAFGFGLTVDETQQLLRRAGKSLLYPRLKRDAVILFCLSKSMNVLEAQERLASVGLTQLGSVPKYED